MIPILIFSIGVFLCVFSIILVCYSLYNRKLASSLIAVLISVIGICVIYYAKNQLEEQRDKLEHSITKNEIEHSITKNEIKKDETPYVWGKTAEALSSIFTFCVLFYTTLLHLKRMGEK